MEPINHKENQMDYPDSNDRLISKSSTELVKQESDPLNGEKLDP